MIDRFRIGLPLLLGLLLTSQVAFAQAKTADFEDVLKRSIETMRQMNEALSKVKDEATAEAQKPTIQRLAGQMAGLQKERKQLGALPDDADKTLKTYADQVRKEAKAMIAHLIRINENKYVGRIVENALAAAKLADETDVDEN